MIRRFVPEGVRIPRGYGVAWRDPMWMGAVCYPVGLNLLARWLRTIWWRLRAPRVGVPEQLLFAAYAAGLDQGRREGQRDGIDAGLRVGWEDHGRQLLMHLDKAQRERAGIGGSAS